MARGSFRELKNDNRNWEGRGGLTACEWTDDYKELPRWVLLSQREDPAEVALTSQDFLEGLRPYRASVCAFVLKTKQ